MTVPPRNTPPSAVPPGEARDARLRRYWRSYNRPYFGCGFLWTALLLMFVYWLLSWWFPSLIPSAY